MIDESKMCYIIGKLVDTVTLSSRIKSPAQRSYNTINIVLFKSFNQYMLKVNNRNTRKKCEICLQIAIKTLKARH